MSENTATMLDDSQVYIPSGGLGDLDCIQVTRYPHNHPAPIGIAPQMATI
ncbi:MAG: hypothetical protein ACE5FD_04070 [Anaerolineae bacterium]